MSRVKQIHEEKKSCNLLIDYNRKQKLSELRDKHSPEFSNWRGTVTEGMNTGNVFFTTLPSTGEVDLETITTQSSGSFEGVGSNSALENTVVKGSGSGTGSEGGFNIGNHLAFQGDGQPRWAILKPIDSSKFDTISIKAIRGNDNNGGEDPEAPGEQLRLYYLPPGGNSFRSISVNPDGEQVHGPDTDVIIPLGSTSDGLRDWEIALPSYARGTAFRYMLYQITNDGASFDHYGITQINYKRRAPISVFVSLDSPEAVSFISDGSGNMTPAEKKKRLEDMLSASDEYQSRQFPFNKAAYEKAAKDVARNIQISLDLDTVKFPEYKSPTWNELFPDSITDSSSAIQIDRYMESKGLSFDNLTKDAIQKNFDRDSQLNIINTSDVENRDKFLTALGIDVGNLNNLSDDTYRKLSDSKIYIQPGGTPSTGWDGKMYEYNSPELEKSRIVPLETYLEAKKRDGYYGVERPDVAPPGSRYVMEKRYGFSSDDDATPSLTGPQNETFKKQSEDAEYNIGRLGIYGVLGYRWDLRHFEKGLGSGHQRLEAGSNFARGQVIESMTKVLNHMYNNRDLLAFAYASEYGNPIDSTAEYDPLYFLLKFDDGKRALQIASSSNARQLDYPISSFGTANPEQSKLYNDQKNDRTVADFKKAYDRIKSMSTDFASYDKDEWYVKNKGATGGQSNVTVGSPTKAHPYANVNMTDPTDPTDPTPPEDKNYPPELNDTGGQAWEQGNTITKQGFKKSDGDFDIFVAGGGNAKMAQGFTYEQVMEIGRKNLNVAKLKNIDNKGDMQIRVKGGNVDLLNYQSNLGFSAGADGTYNTGVDVAAGLAPEMGMSVLTGRSREMKLGDRAKQEMIDSIDYMELERALQIGPKINPSVSNAVTPTPGKKLKVLTGVYGVPGAVEVNYDPGSDTFTITSNKMLRTGLSGDQYNGDRQTRFGDIPPPSSDSIAKLGGQVVTKMFSSFGVEPPGGISPAAMAQILRKEYTDTQWVNGMLGAAAQVLDFAVQGSASNIVAIRKLMTDSGIIKKSDMEKTGGGYGHVYSQTSYSGSEIPQGLRQYLDRRMDKDDLGGGSLGDTLQGIDASDAATVSADNKKKKKTNAVAEMYEPKAKHNDKVAKVTGRLKTVSDFLNNPDVKPVFPKDPPPEMINGRHPDLVDGEKISNRFNKLDPTSAKSMPKTGNPKIDAKVAKALKRPK